MELIQLAQWSGILIGALFVLVRGADLFVEGAKRIGAHLGMSSFAIGVLIVGLGTSLPELASSMAAVLAGSTEIVIANAVGSNITNILLIVGIFGYVGRTGSDKQKSPQNRVANFLYCDDSLYCVCV